MSSQLAKGQAEIHLSASRICMLKDTRVHTCLKRSKTILRCRLIFLSCGMDAHEGGVRCYTSKQVSLEQPGMHALQPALHVCSSVTDCQILHCHIILQSKQCHLWMQDTPSVMSGQVTVHAKPGCMCSVSTCRYQSRHSVTNVLIALFICAFSCSPMPSSHSLFNPSFCHSVIHSLNCALSRAFSCPSIHSIILSFIHPFIQSFSHSFMHSFIHSFLHSFIPSFHAA